MKDWMKMAQKPQPPAVPTIYLLRHGKTKFNTDGSTPDRIRGWEDVPLDETGKEQAEDVGQFFKGRHIDAIFTSDLSRCRDVAEEISKATGVPVTAASKKFRPWNLGSFQGQNSRMVAEQIKEKYIEEPDLAVPNGESFNSFERRYLSTLRRLMSALVDGDYKAIVIVAHYRNLKISEAWAALGCRDALSKSVFLSDDTDPASIVELQYRNHKWEGHKLDDTGVEPSHEKDKE